MKILLNFDLSSHNSYKVKSFCARAFFPSNEEDFLKIYSRYENGEKKIILGGGNNVILKKAFYENDFIIVGNSFSKITFLKENLIEAEAGVDMKILCEKALEKSLTGFETFFDIPSSLGGAVVMNAGAGGVGIKDLLYKVRYIDLTDLKIKEILTENIEYSYRNSYFQRNPDNIVLKAWLKLSEGNSVNIWQKMQDIKKARWKKQPRDFPNAGSVFKRPIGAYVGPMVEGLGLKGYSIGGAEISDKHAGFIINRNEATGHDIVKLIEVVKEKVYSSFGYDLEVEQRII